MKILAVDDEWIALDNLENCIRKCMPQADLVTFDDPFDALDDLQTNEYDVAFLDIEMGEISGVELAKKLKEKKPDCNIVFSTGYTNYWQQAFQINASDYLLKPISVEKVQHALDGLRYPVRFEVPNDKLFVQCFGEFEVFFQGAPLTKLKGKIKELFAYIVDRHGAMCTAGEVTETIWEGGDDSNFRKAQNTLLGVLAEIGQSSAVIKERGVIGVDKSKICCDYYEYLDGNPAVVNMFKGEYMSQYEWAIYTAENLNKKVK